MISHLRGFFLDVSIIAILTMIILIILEYIYQFLKLRFSTWLYWKSLDKPNIPYIISKITKSKFKDLLFFIYNNSETSTISKILIFVNNIKKK